MNELVPIILIAKYDIDFSDLNNQIRQIIRKYLDLHCFFCQLKNQSFAMQLTVGHILHGVKSPVCGAFTRFIS